jgi:hypothetical protein
MMKRLLVVLIGCFMLAVLPTSAQTITPIRYGDTVTGTITDDNQYVIYSFNASAGDIVTITMVATSGSLDPILLLFTDDSNMAFAGNDDAEVPVEGTYNSQISQTVIPRDGVYFIEAKRYGGTGNFRLDLELVGSLWDYTPSVLDGGTSYSGSLSNDTPFSYYEFSGAAGDAVTISMSADGGTLDPQLYLYSPNNVLLQANDDATEASGDSQIVYTLAESGTHQVVALRFNGYGTYSLDFATTGTGSTIDSVPALSDGASLQYGDSVRGTIDDVNFEERYTFSGTAGDVVTITMVADAGTNLDSYLYLYEGNGFTQLIYNDDATDPAVGRLNSQILEFVLPDTADYVIAASRFSGTGGYTLTLASGEDTPRLLFTAPTGWAVEEHSGSYLIGSDQAVIDRLLNDPSLTVSGSDQVVGIYFNTAGDGATLQDTLRSVQANLAGPTTNYGPASTETTVGNVRYVSSTVEEDGIEGILYIVDVADAPSNVVVQVLMANVAEGTAIADSIVASLSYGTGDSSTLQVGSSTVSLPEGWVNGLLDSEVLIATDSSTLSVLEGGGFGVIADGQIGISIITLTPDILAVLGNPETVLDVLNSFSSLINSTGVVTDYTRTSVPAAITFTAGDNSVAPPRTVVVATQSGQDYLLWAIQVGANDTYEQHEDVILSVINSLR